eukprot:11938908-Alexandrium_andersonii.AAC.1
MGAWAAPPGHRAECLGQAGRDAGGCGPPCRRPGRLEVVRPLRFGVHVAPPGGHAGEDCHSSQGLHQDSWP